MLEGWLIRTISFSDSVHKISSVLNVGNVFFSHQALGLLLSRCVFLVSP